jgi:hypothetical protein
MWDTERSRQLAYRFLAIAGQYLQCESIARERSNRLSGAGANTIFEVKRRKQAAIF